MASTPSVVDDAPCGNARADTASRQTGARAGGAAGQRPRDPALRVGGTPEAFAARSGGSRAMVGFESARRLLGRIDRQRAQGSRPSPAHASTRH
jgi:hypothetical protein